MNEHQLKYLKLAKEHWDTVFGIKDTPEDRLGILEWAKYMLDYDSCGEMPIQQLETPQNQTETTNNDESKQATDSQLTLLKKLGHKGSLPLTMNGASTLIRELLEVGGKP